MWASLPSLPSPWPGHGIKSADASSPTTRRIGVFSKNNHFTTMTSKKNFFVKTDDQKEALKKTLSDFGTQQLSFLDAIIGGDVPTLPGFLKVDPPYAESTKYVQIY